MPTPRLAALLAALAAAALAPAPAALAQDAGAPQQLVVTETHGDWEIVCVAGQPPCVMRQDGVTADGQRALEMSVRKIEPRQTEQGTVESILTVAGPLGILLRQGLTLQIDAAEPSTGLFTLCTVDGCTLSEPAPNALVERFKRGAQAKLSYVIVQGQQAGRVEATVSLRGFTAAFNALPPS